MNASDNPADWGAQPATPISITTPDERTWGMLAELSGLLSYVIPLGSILAPLTIYLMYKDTSRFVAFHAMQALYLQLAIVGMIVLLVALSFLTCGVGLLVAIPVGLVLGPGSLVLIIIAAIKANAGDWFEIWYLGRWARGSVDG